MRTSAEKAMIVLLRLGLGWLIFYAGITKVLNPEWSAAGYIGASKNFTVFYTWLLSPEILPIINFLNAWGLTLIGISLILGIAVRLSSVFGAMIMILYYIPILDFPYPNTHSYLVDEHIVYALAFLFLGAVRAGRFIGFENLIARVFSLDRSTWIRRIIG